MRAYEYIHRPARRDPTCERLLMSYGTVALGAASGLLRWRRQGAAHCRQRERWLYEDLVGALQANQ